MVIDNNVGRILENQKTHAERTAAADIAVAFDYQYYYFLFRVLKLGLNESVGLEVKDDVHTDLDNDRQILIQLKHTTQKNAGGFAKNLTNFDSDLWKTLSNWSKVIADKNAGRQAEKDQLAFISKTEFMLVSNKSHTASCEFFSILETPKNAKSKFATLKSNTQDKTIQEYIENILSLSEAVLEAYIHNVVIELGVDEIIKRCKDAIIEKQVPDKAVDQLFCDLDSRIKQDNFIAIHAGEKIVISFEDFRRRYRKYFEIARNPELKVARNYEPLPLALNEQTFIKQLIDIGEIQEEHDELMAEYTRYMLMVKISLESWHQKGELTSEEIVNFNNEAKIRWKNKFRAKSRQINHKMPNELALELLDEMRAEKLNINSQQMETDFSNGEYYYLSDKPEIGWQQDWERKYK
ncbi:MAG: hypothetical protein ISR72_08410 [Methylobacter sp.]|nr:hypothetical protein [Methylobacter sp.]